MILVKDKLPNDGDEILAYDPIRGFYICEFYWDEAHMFSEWIGENTTEVLHPTHWQELPDEPKETG